MVEKDNAPQIRISRFTKEWNTALLSYYLETSKAKNFDESFKKEDVLSVSGDAGVVNQMEYQGKSFAGASLSNYGVVSTDDIVYTKSPLRYQPYGIIKTNIGKPGIVSALYAVYHPKDTVYAPFVQTYFNLDKRLNGYLLPVVSKGAKNTINVGDDAVLLGTVCFPEYDEQQAVTNIFSNLEKLIVQSKSKLEKLHALKASMLEKMFPKGGADVPEVRFKGFDKPWRTIFLKDIASEIIRTDKTSKAPIMMITAANGFIDQSDRYSFNNAGQSLAKYIVLKKGELAYNHGASKLRPYGSCFALEVDEARIPYVYHCFTISEHNPYFVSRVLNNKETEKQLRKLVTSGARMDGLLNISYEEYTTVTIQLPERDEQDRIAEYFENIENLIVLCQQELDKLQSVKKALLEKMFV